MSAAISYASQHGRRLERGPSDRWAFRIVRLCFVLGHSMTEQAVITGQS
jgi:hypothetical protein